ncbi:MAG: hypothetical protein ACE5GY_09110 [Thermodesulfobacteriota bacterium]
MPFKFKRAFLLLLLVVAVMLPGCAVKDLLFKQDHSRADRFARGFIETLRSGDMDTLKDLSVLDIGAESIRGKLLEMKGQLDRGEMVSVETISAQDYSSYFSSISHTLLGYQITFEGSWLKALVLVDEADGVQKVSTIYTEPLARPMQELYAFNFSDMTFAHYAALFFAVAVPLFIIYNIAQCIMTQVRFKILWISFMLVGIGTIIFDWSSAHMGFKLFAPMFLGSGAHKATIYGPWVLKTSLPVGALIFYFYRNKLIERQILKNRAEALKAGRHPG